MILALQFYLRKIWKTLKKISSFHLRLGGKRSLAPPLIVLVGMSRLAPLDPPLSTDHFLKFGYT